MSLRLVAHSTLWQLASQVVMAALSILTVKFVALGLTKELAGNYNSAYGYLQLFGILADFGLYAVAVREMSKTDERERILGALLILRGITVVFSLIVALLFAWALPMWRGTPLPLGITIAALVPFFTLLAGMIRVIFQVEYKMHYVFFAEVTQRVITVSLIGLFIVMGIRGSNDLHIYHLFLFIGGVGAFVLFFLSFIIGDRLIRIRPSWNGALMKRLARSALPYGAAFLCMALYRQLDVTLIALLRPDYDLQNAYYGFVVRMADMGFLIPTFLLNSVLPLLGKEGDTARVGRIFGKTLFILLVLGSISMLFSLLWSVPLIRLLTTEMYVSTPFRPGSDTALRLLSAPLFLNGIVLFGFYVLLTAHAWKKLVRTMAGGALLSLVLNLFLIPRFGFVGAAVTSVIVHAALAVSLWLQSRTVLHVRFPRAYALQWALFTVVLGAVLVAIRPFLTNELATVAGLAFVSLLLPVIAYALRMHRTALL